ncbi:MAG: hypothetical protein ACE5JU_22275, partial [Candidatus Binatia bacterium]
MKGIDAHLTARKDMAREKARIYRKETKPVSPLETGAQKWLEEREEEERVLEEEKGLQRQTITPDRPSTSHYPGNGKSVDPVGWAQYNPWRKEEEKEGKKQRQVNTATIWCWAKKLIAREWARAKGIKRKDPRIYALEREAAQWREKREEERKRSEEK